MNSSIRLALFLSLVAGLSLGTTFQLGAQDSTVESAVPQNAGVPVQPPFYFDVNFQGGSVEAYISMLKDIAEKNRGGDVNVILDENVKDVVLPHISFNHVPLDAAIQVLERIRFDDARINISNTKSIYVVSAQHSQNVPQRTATPPKRNPETVVFSVREILSQTEEEDLLSAIEIGLNLDGKESSALMKLHQETGLLFVKGSRDQLRLISDIVEQLAAPVREARQADYQRRMQELKNMGQRNRQQSGNGK